MRCLRRGAHLSGSPPIRYTKPWLAVADQLTKLQLRGLAVGNVAEAETFLAHVNYYRFTGYCLAFEKSRDRFRPGVSFDQLRQACQFDATLRDLFTEALELIEIDIRTTTAYAFGETFGAFGHSVPASFHPRFDFKGTHAEWLDKLRKETQRSSELFVRHFRSRYREFPDLPIWAVTEVMSFGSVSRMIGGLQKNDRRRIASQYGVSPKVLSSLTHHLAYVRNLCAHHCRLWDRVWSVKPDLPDSADWRGNNVVSNERVFSTLLLMRQLLKRSPHLKSEADRWRERVNELLTVLPSVPDPGKELGLTADWQQHPVWR